jgi:hypothetical protein
MGYIGTDERVVKNESQKVDYEGAKSVQLV